MSPSLMLERSLLFPPPQLQFSFKVFSIVIIQLLKFMLRPEWLHDAIQKYKDRSIIKHYERMDQNMVESYCQFKECLRKLYQPNKSSLKGDSDDVSLQSLTLLLIGVSSFKTNDYVMCRLISRFAIEQEKNPWLQIEFMYLMIQSLQRLNQLKECMEYTRGLIHQIKDDEGWSQLRFLLEAKQEYIHKFLAENQNKISDQAIQVVATRLEQLFKRQKEENYFEQVGNPVYLLSTQWMSRWAALTGHKRIPILKTNDLEDEALIAVLKQKCSQEQSALIEELERISNERIQEKDLLTCPIFNDDLLDTRSIKHDPFPFKQYTNYRLHSNVREGEHYQIVANYVWVELHKLFGGMPVRRTVISKDGECGRAEIQLFQVQYYLHQESKSKFSVQLHSNERIYDLIEKVERIHQCKVAQIWKCSQFDHQSVCGSEMNHYVTIDGSELGVEDFLVIQKEGTQLQVRKILTKVPDYCNLCKRNDIELSFCECQQVKYCNSSCQQRDRKDHQDDCKKRLQKDEFINQQAKKFKVKPPSQLGKASSRGLCGLNNLGNTCFMNSSLQCLSHVTELTNFMISNDFLSDINEKNPLGTGGKLACAYSDLLKDLWDSQNNSVAPWNVKNVIGRYAPQFSGYIQQDSSELLSYLLDGLNEDLNRVKKKPYIPEVEYKGQQDDELAQIYWQNHLSRNNSVITDLFTGQYKSRVECPDCHFVSVTFDPYIIVSLPIPIKEYLQFNFYLIFRDSNQIPLRFSFSLLSTTQASDVIQLVSEYQSIKPEYLRFYQLQDSTIVDNGVNLTMTVKQMKDTQSTIFLYEIYNEALDNGKDIEIQLNICNQVKKDIQKISYTRLFYVNSETTYSKLQFAIYCLIRPFLLFINEQIYSVQMKDFEIFLRNLKRNNFKTTQEEFSAFQQIKDVYEIPELKQANPKDALRSNQQLQLVFCYQVKQEQLKLNRCLDSNQHHTQKQNLNQCTLADCLNQFCQEEVLEQGNEWYCSKCKQHKRAKKQMQVYKAPKILILALKRFRSSKIAFQYGTYYHTGGASKIVQFVDYPVDRLEMRNFIVDKSSNYVYDLFAVSNHYGGLGSGHYTAYAKNNNIWYDFNDSSVRELRQSPVTDAAYVLFYRQRQR